MPVKNRKPLTPRQKNILDFINDFVEEKGYAPSFNEIAKHSKKAIGTVQHYISELEEKGHLLKEDHAARSIRTVPEDSNHIFLLGYIAAGKPIEPIENPEPVQVPLSMTSPTGEYYALKVQGDSMIEEGIMDGDTIVVKHQKTAEHGDIVVAVTEHGATLKVFKKKNNRITLKPRNKHLKEIYPKELEIRGRFCGLIRNGQVE